MHYLKLEQQRDVFGTLLASLISFSYMTHRKLKKVLTCNVLDPELASEIVLDALFSRTEAKYGQHSLVAED